jgi:site-specific DNA-cytosine methylase
MSVENAKKWPPPANQARLPQFYEFFAGSGGARAGLGDGWQCLLANDNDPAKMRSYTDNWASAARSPAMSRP